MTYLGRREKLREKQLGRKVIEGDRQSLGESG